MSRKSRQKKGNALLQKIPPVSVCIFLLIAGLWMGALFSLRPWYNEPALLEDTVSRSITMQKVRGLYNTKHKNRLSGINIYYADEGDLVYLPDMEVLYIPSVLTSKTLLDKLTAYPAGTVFDVRTEPDDRDILALSVEGTELISFEQACRRIRTDNVLFVGVGVFMLCAAGYAAWALYIHGKYRRLA